MVAGRLGAPQRVARARRSAVAPTVTRRRSSTRSRPRCSARCARRSPKRGVDARRRRRGSSCTDTPERLAALDRGRGRRPRRRLDRASSTPSAGDDVRGRGRARAEPEAVTASTDLRRGAGVARRAREPRDRRRRPVRHRPAEALADARRASRRSPTCSGRRSRQYPAVHLTGTNGKTSVDPDDRRAARRRSGSRPARTRARTSSGSTSGWPGRASRSPTTRSPRC